MKNRLMKISIILFTVFFLSPLFKSNVILAAETVDTSAEKQIWSFVEGDRNKKHSIEIRAGDLSFPIIDINSRITVTIDKSALRAKAAEIFGTSTPDEMKKLMTTMDEIKAILDLQADFMKSIIIEPGDDRNTVQRKIESYRDIMGRLLKIAENPSSRIGKLVETTYMNAFDDPLLQTMTGEEKTIEIYSRVFSALGNEIETFSGKLNAALRTVSFRMGGWIEQNGASHPIHINGFDDYEPGQYTRIPFVTKPTPEAFSEKMESIRTAARKANEEGISAVISVNVNLKEMGRRLRNDIIPAVTCVTDAASGMVKDIKEELTSTVQLPETTKFLEQLKSLKNKVADFIDSTNSLTNTASELKTNLEGQYNLFFNAQTLSVGMREDIKNILDSFNKARDEILNSIQKVKSEEFKNKIRDILDVDIKECLAKFETVKDTFLGFVNEFWTIVKNKFSVTMETEPVLSEFGEEVKRLQIDEVPDIGVFDLQYTGTREEGDIVTIEAVLERISETGEPSTQKKFRQSFIMFRIFKIVINPGLIFADPLVKKDKMADKAVTLGKQFQAVPSYSILFKFGNRKSIAYNKYFRFGLGLNIAALDFNQDSNYELGLGLVLSTLKDYLQVGIGRNMESDSWYWFFGLNIPFASISLPAGGSTNPK
jgi:hypothetical protein